MLFDSKSVRRFSSVLVLSASFLTLSAQVRTRINGTVDNSSTVHLPRTTHPLANAANDIGRVDASLPMARMTLHLTSSAEQESAIESLLAAQHDPASPSYRQWLTPAQFGQQFGVAQADLDAVTGWLQSQGFTVNAVAAGRRSVEFSGTASQVEQAFHTEMHRYRVNGEEHVANATDISIPSALAPVVGGVVSLHNFRAHPLHKTIAHKPLTALSGGANALSPYDFAAIYDVAALWNLNFDGTGQTIAVAGRTNINPTDITTFRSTFGLPVNNTQIVLNGTNPGIVSSDEETEADLDVEWSGAVAKGATIKFVVSASTNSSDGVDLSDQYIVDNNLAPVLSLSFGGCEAENGSANAFYNSLWQQAATQGISVFVAAGDSGSAGCDVDYSTSKSGADNTTPASHGFGVNGLASTPYNVAVGGTEFNDAANPSTYWSSSNNSTTKASATGYIPEVVWNESSYTVGETNNSLLAGSGGVSELWATPAWQTGTGVPTSDPGASGQHHRYLPDVALSAAGHDGYLIYQEGELELVGGTSASTPSFAGLMAIIDQYTGGARSGNPNTRLYPLATQYPSLFHDVTSGTNAVPCVGGSLDCSSTSASTTGVMTGYNAAPGYDLASGLGSVDAYALALKWSNGPAPLSITSLSPNPMTASASSQTLTINGTGFVTGDTVKVSYTGFSGTLTVTSLTATQILATINTGTTPQVWTVQVATASGAVSNSASLTVNAAAAIPAIASLSPNPMTGSNSSQTLTITGTGFATGDTVQATYAGGTVSTLPILSVSATQIQASMVTGTTARTWTVKVINANSVTSNSASLTVNAPAATTPAITSLSPNPMTGSNSYQTLTIIGTGFATGDTVQATYPGGAVSTLPILSVSATQIQASIATGTTARTWTVQVVNANNAASNSASLTVTAPAAATKPAITSVSSVTATNTNQTVTITGTGFSSGAQVVIGYNGYGYYYPVISATATQIQVLFDPGTTPRLWEVEVIDSNGAISNVATFQ
jgi:hypothetical protein